MREYKNSLKEEEHLMREGEPREHNNVEDKWGQCVMIKGAIACAKLNYW